MDTCIGSAWVGLCLCCSNQVMSSPVYNNLHERVGVGRRRLYILPCSVRNFEFMTPSGDNGWRDPKENRYLFSTNLE